MASTDTEMQRQISRRRELEKYGPKLFDALDMVFSIRDAPDAVVEDAKRLIAHAIREHGLEIVRKWAKRAGLSKHDLERLEL